ncbi:hypothetical protein V5F49_11190 [Xanthobacter sp. V3C-3]|uniref:hypothetical protein n=1 Tax=Xanthobacter lutulentifluminis TaxID=3119935 RepID=UPI003728D4AF
MDKPLPFDPNRGLINAEHETLWCLFRNGPTWDGNLPSKQGRDGLVASGYAARCDGWNFLTEAGVQLAIDLRFDRRKEKDRPR